MAEGDAKPSKRSRFDQKEADRKRSRFDRRSRSPVRQTELKRSRSPQERKSKSPEREKRTSTASDPAAAAAAAAARINAQIQAKKSIQHVDVPPIKNPPSQEAPAPAASTKPAATAKVNSEMYVADGDYIKDIEINDLLNRYTLTKGATQKMIKDETGADVTTRGEFYPNKSMATAAKPPLYLHITSQTKEGLEQAVAKIEEMMKQDLPKLVDERRFRRRDQDQQERDDLGRRKFHEERIPIDLEPIPGFNLRAQVVGHGGAYVKHIQQETRCRVQIKGRGSGFFEHATGQESDEPMYLHVSGPDLGDVEKAKGLCVDLLENVREQYQRHKDNPNQRGGYGGGGYGDRQSGYGNSSSNYGYGGYGSGYGSSYGSSNNNQSGGAQSPTAPGASSSAQPDYTAQWQQYFAQNPQAAQYYYYQQQAAQQQAPGAPGEASPPPPPS